MRLHDAQSGTLRRLRARPGRPLGVYVCGVTPYDTTHLGHAFTYHVFDLLIRYVEVVEGRRVRYVQNVTDIDDDILRKAAETGEDWRALGLRWTEVFRRDLGRLGLRPPDDFPGATAYIGPIREAVAALLEADAAYERGGSVYYRVASDPDFGARLGWSRERMLAVANERGNVPDDPSKDDPLDFVLWQAGTPGEPAWNSPWGPGRPGWHIECSTMASDLLGEEIDVHGGGADLAFPHHECERAQAERILGRRPWVRHWVHVAMVRMDGEKMSKSLGNLVLLRELLAEHEPDHVRLYLMRHHYRTAWEWDAELFADTAAWARTLHAAARRTPGDGRELDFSTYGPRVTSALAEDLDSPRALEALLALADDILAAPLGADVRGAQDVLRTLGRDLLGLRLRPGEELTEAERAAWPEPRIAPPDVVLGDAG